MYLFVGDIVWLQKWCDMEANLLKAAFLISRFLSYYIVIMHTVAIVTRVFKKEVDFVKRNHEYFSILFSFFLFVNKITLQS